MQCNAVTCFDFGVSAAMLRSGFGQARICGLQTRFPSLRGPVAQLAEQQTLNLRVLGSTPSWLTMFAHASFRRTVSYRLQPRLPPT